MFNGVLAGAAAEPFAAATGRCAVEACHTQGFELGHRFESGNPQQVELRLRCSDPVDG